VLRIAKPDDFTELGALGLTPAAGRGASGCWQASIRRLSPCRPGSTSCSRRLVAGQRGRLELSLPVRSASLKVIRGSCQPSRQRFIFGVALTVAHAFCMMLSAMRVALRKRPHRREAEMVWL
jgi:hypothetical protein